MIINMANIDPGSAVSSLSNQLGIDGTVDLPSADADVSGSNPLASYLAGFINKLDGAGASSIATAKSGTLSPQSLLDIQKEVTNYSTTLNVASKVAGELSSAITKLTSLD